MKKTLYDGSLFSQTCDSIKSIVKLILKSHRCHLPTHGERRRIIVMGNGPSLSQTISEYNDVLINEDTMAVNFAANTPEFTLLKPKFYILADPHFFNDKDDTNVTRLIDRINAVSWPMTLLIPFGSEFPASGNPDLKIVHYNAIGIEGFRWITDLAYRSGRGMPRPRNVLIPAIMCAIRMGYPEIYIVGADHSWIRTIDVDSDNHVVSLQPHFYKEDEKETQRIRKAYLNYPLHSIMKSFYIAFHAYHLIAGYAKRHNIAVYNSSPVSFIDAFPRRRL